MKTLTYFKQFENEGISQCWERYLELLHFFPPHVFETWQVISRFYNSLIEKSCQVLDMSSVENFIEKEPTMVMMILDNLLARETHEPGYELIME